MRLHLTIKQRLVLLMSSLIVIAISLCAPFVYMNYKMNHIAYQIDLAGRNRMLAQGISTYILSLSTAKTEGEVKSIHLALNNDCRLLNSSLKTLQEGGIAPEYVQFTPIAKPTEDERFQIQLVKEILETQELDFINIMLTEKPFLKEQTKIFDTLSQTSNAKVFIVQERHLETFSENSRFQKAFARFTKSHKAATLISACSELVKTYANKNHQANAFLHKYMIFAAMALLLEIIVVANILKRITLYIPSSSVV
jgi:hypothetical protein